MIFYPHKSKPPQNKFESEDNNKDTFLDLLIVVVLERLSHDSKGKFLTAQVMASASLIVGMLNAFL